MAAADPVKALLGEPAFLAVGRDCDDSLPRLRRTGEIGAIRVTQIEKKGKQNRRVRISFA